MDTATWLHGEAVSVGMACAAKLAEKHGMVGSDLGRRQNALLEAFALPTSPKSEWATDALIAIMKRDKKAAAGRMRFVLPDANW